VARLDVIDAGGARLLGIRNLLGTDFRSAETYQEFAIDFNYPDEQAMGLEFRTAFWGVADLSIDRVLVVTYPEPPSDTAFWQLSPGAGEKTVIVKYVDRAGNAAADVAASIILTDTLPRFEWRAFDYEWQGAWEGVTSTVQVLNATYGLDVDSARYRYTDDAGGTWSTWAEANCSGIDATTQWQTITAASVPLFQPRPGENGIEFTIRDKGGVTSTVRYMMDASRVLVPLLLPLSQPGNND
jgi:hypothetical protein